MGSLAAALGHDNAISSTATCSAAADGVLALDALGSLDTHGLPWGRLLPWLLEATSESLTPQTSPRFDLTFDLSNRLLFSNTTITDESAATKLDQDCQPDGTGLDPSCHAVPDDASLAGDDCRNPFYTFYLSPSTSTLSVDSCRSDGWTPEPSLDSRDTEQTTTMPGATIDFPPSTSSTDEHFEAPSHQVDGDAMKRRPLSARSGNINGATGNRRPASPVFSRWAKRHQHHQHGHRHHSGKLQAPSGRVFPDAKVSGSSSAVTVKRPAARSRSSSMQKNMGAVPQMTREEFEALPLAIQRKYFSTLERLRFARDSGHVDGISQHYDEITHFKRRKPRQDRSVSEQISSRLIRRRSLIDSQHNTPGSFLSCSTLPEKIQNREFTREEQVVLARRLRASVILDAADEAICKLNRRASRRLVPEPAPLSSSIPSARSSMDSHHGARSPQDQGEIPQSFYETFRWLDEEDDLDLRLFLDDYHANLRDNMTSPTKQQRPSFRRHLSISKIPFGRNSLSSSSRPATKDATSPSSPLHSPYGGASNNPLPHTRRKSRALSLITPKHTPQDSVTAFDPSAAHYQDPEARLKLRVYLASPQKFDEAIEFGFPSADVLSAAPVITKDGGLSNQRRTRQKPSDDSSNMRTFLADFDDDDDDNVSLNSDQVSLADPDSPKTPQAFDSKPGAIRPLRIDPTEPIYLRDNKNTSEGGGYAQAPASSREMTLRMTLTRPDLRAHEEQIYGWQQRHPVQSVGRKSTTLAPLAMESVTYMGDAAQKESLERMAAFDWNSPATDRGVMKRIWNRVRRA